MKIIIYILLFLLIVSIANNYILHFYQNKDKNSQESSVNFLVEPSKLPENIGIMSLYIFYDKTKKYDKCHQNDQFDKDDSSNKSELQVNMKKIISDIYKKNNHKCYIIKKNTNENTNLDKYLDNAIKKITK